MNRSSFFFVITAYILNLNDHMFLVEKTKQKQLFKIEKTAAFKQKALIWSAQSEVCCFLDSNQYLSDTYGKAEAIIGSGVETQIFKSDMPSFEQLKNFHQKNKSFLFGFLAYDLKNEVEQLGSENLDGLEFPEMHFFQPTTCIKITAKIVEIQSYEKTPETILQEILNIENIAYPNQKKPTQLKSRFSKKEYIQTVQAIKNHIVEGDIYEMNFCQEFYLDDLEISPVDLFLEFNALSKAPFSCFYKLKNKFLLCASPERYLKKEGKKLISQPIKGTIRRGENEEEDRQLKNTLKNSEKDRAENVMIVDLVRNDLARSCDPGSVQVEELFGIYPFEQVYQMISSIKGDLRKDLHFTEAIKNSFPMGSMTGAPKVMAMQLIEQYEKTKRGLYSGAVGYIDSNGDFDFNVVIRGMQYNADKKYLSFQVGGAIVYDSVPEQEYEECLLKAKAILKVLNLNA